MKKKKLTDKEKEQREKETDMLAQWLIDKCGVEFWQKYFEGEFDTLN